MVECVTVGEAGGKANPPHTTHQPNRSQLRSVFQLPTYMVQVVYASTEPKPTKGPETSLRSAVKSLGLLLMPSMIRLGKDPDISNRADGSYNSHHPPSASRSPSLHVRSCDARPVCLSRTWRVDHFLTKVCRGRSPLLLHRKCWILHA